VIDKLKLTDYSLTEKGEAQLHRWAEMGYEFGGRPKSIEKFYEVLEAISDYLPLKEDLDPRVISELERRGLVEYNPSDTIQILSDIKNPDMRRDLGIYRRIARGERITPMELNGLYSRVRDMVEKVCFGHRPGLRGVTRDEVDRLWEVVKEADTKADKILAIDVGMSLIHSYGRIPMVCMWDVSEDEEDWTSGNRLLTRLAEAEEEDVGSPVRIRE